MRNKDIDVQSKIIPIKQVKSEQDCPRLCTDSGCGIGSCGCFIPFLNACGCLSNVITVTNADVKIITRKKRIFFTYRASDCIQFSLISNPSKGKLLIRTFKFPNKKNHNKSRGFIQIASGERMIRRTIFLGFNQKRFKCGCKQGVH
ncbi:hypothetical protein IC620_13355 [Hazenella sp. IB182357]|uniref:Uncharacterized protein n=1 Tax=Polycladospora coralii TaxID=2771432 RepID=A0A926RTX9_9BACL|nr:hypothetical protein [Polycladospora coralii]MBD1373335.1 hypothetical protein [Polycladospora coralii]MBS7528948.1 hypothetical protein [Polycladospora coralii]